ncbi:acetyltransferase, partial [Escherichia coli]
MPSGLFMDLLPFLLDANLSATNPPAIPHWWKRQPLIPNLLSQELKNYLKLNVKEKNIQIADQVIIDETAGEVVIGANTRICHGAVIQGPVVIGANCLIGNYAFIR